MASEPTAPDANEPTAEATVESAPAPEKRTARKRATKSTSRARKTTTAPPAGEVLEETDPVGQPEQVEQAERVEQAAADSADDTTELAPAPAARTRRSRKKAAPVEPAQQPDVDSATADQAAPEPAEPVDSAVEPADTATETTANESDPDEPEIDETENLEVEDAAEQAATVPSFGLLFQAPEPVAPRRRRATSAAGAPTSATSSGSESGDDDSNEGAATDRSAAPGREASAETETDAEQDDSTNGSDEGDSGTTRRSRRRGGRGRRARGSEDSAGEDTQQEQGARTSGATDSSTDAGDSDDVDSRSQDGDSADDSAEGSSSSRRRRRRRRSSDGVADSDSDESRGARAREQVTGLKGSTRLEAKKQRRREGREAGRRRQIITEAEFLARRESVERVMVVRERAAARGSKGAEAQTQIGVLEDGVLVEHYVSRETGASMIGNVYLGRVQNVLPSMEAAFVDIGKGRNAVLYAGEVNWDAAGLEGNMPKRIENALTSGDTVLVQVTKDPIGHKGARLTSQISLPGRFLVYVPEASMTGISRKLPDTERARLKSILKKIVPDDAGVIVRTAAEGASEEELTADIERLTKAWDRIRTKSEKAAKRKGGAPVLLHGEPDLTVKVIRDVFNEDFTSLVVSGDKAWDEVSEYLEDVAPELAKRLIRWTAEKDLFSEYRVDEQLAKALDRKVWLPSGGSLVIDRTEAMTVVDVNTGKFVGSGGNLEETVTKNNIEAAEEIVRQLRLRDIGGIIVIDFIDMVLEVNRDLVVRRLLECLGRDRTKHQVAEVTSLGLVQMTRKRVGSGLLEVFSESCSHCNGRGLIVHSDPIDPAPADDGGSSGGGRGRGRGRGGSSGNSGSGNSGTNRGTGDKPGNGPTAAQIAAAAHAAALKAVAASSGEDEEVLGAEIVDAPAGDIDVAEIDVLAADEPTADQVPDADVASEVPIDGSISDGPTRADAGDQSDAGDASHTDALLPEPTEEPTLPETPEPAQTPTRRPRRRRGRVVSQAGPPGQAEVTVIPAGE